ncbi:MAG: hypothetical protein F4X14_18250 [Caldilineaceae bacterium SB0661_bin_32]|uniref:site-specific DNA-methyltransferase (adenine-specific) n=1 Tax=Caldilineaceae bacterium SB0661_bin_32 TaxID=2605255 RepID=A0A6B1DBA6_9CHLR|nr:hypothetical protein [Caldilineaceae bacterium SB0661_bin_32]
MTDQAAGPRSSAFVASSSAFDIPSPGAGSTPVAYAEALGEAYLSFAKLKHRKTGGHYLTPASVARFMAACSTYSAPHLRVLDPGSGAGILTASVCEAVSRSEAVQRLHVDTYETDPLLSRLTHRVLDYSRDWLSHHGVALTFEVRNKDFVLDYAAAPLLEEAARGENGKELAPRADYDLVISNPPYFKIRKDDPRASARAAVVYGQPNIYALFMAISAELLSESGALVFIVPRSFASGPYFKRFRELFFRIVSPSAIHLFESRKEVFKGQTVLQENLIIKAQRCKGSGSGGGGDVLISHSRGAADIADSQRFLAGMDSVLDPASKNRELSIPLCESDLDLMRVIRSWPNSLHTLGLEISTGPVVPFRATRFLSSSKEEPSTVPLLWMQNVRPMRTDWPAQGTNKPQRIRVASESTKILVRDATYILLRRFSAKEEPRRLVAAPLCRGWLKADRVGLENHLNYIHGVSRPIDAELAYGLSALFNSTLLDRYFRISNGNTQVSATELRAMPLPDEKQIRSIGEAVQTRIDSENDLLGFIDSLVASVLDISPRLCVERGPAAA